MKKQYRQIIGAVLILVTVLCGCRGAAIDKKAEEGKEKRYNPKVVGVSLADKSIYLTRVAEAMEKAAQNEGMEVIFKYAGWDAEEQKHQIEEFIEQGVGSIIIAPVNSKAALIPLKKAKEANIPVINVNMKVDGISSEYIQAYVGASSSEEGEKAAELMIELLGAEGGKIGIVEGSPGSDPQIYRTQAFSDTLEPYSSIQIVGVGNGAWNRTKAKLVTMDLIRKTPDIKGIYCHDSEMAMGAIEALTDMGKIGQVKVIGIAEDEEYMDALEAGKLAGIITQPPEYEGKYSIYCALWKIQGKKLIPWYKDPIQVLTQENFSTYREKW